jgi:hypothetical protein
MPLPSLSRSLFTHSPSGDGKAATVPAVGPPCRPDGPFAGSEAEMSCGRTWRVSLHSVTKPVNRIGQWRTGRDLKRPTPYILPALQHRLVCPWHVPRGTASGVRPIGSTRVPLAGRRAADPILDQVDLATGGRVLTFIVLLLSVMRTILEVHPDIDVVLGADTVVLGALAALREAATTARSNIWVGSMANQRR